jgi:hypothetical protein
MLDGASRAPAAGAMRVEALMAARRRFNTILVQTNAEKAVGFPVTPAPTPRCNSETAADAARLERFQAGGPFWTDEEWKNL